MKTFKGMNNIAGVQVCESSSDCTSDPVGIAVSATLAIVNGESGQRFGAMHKRSWSEKTWAKLRELLEVMEEDALNDLAPGAAGGVVPVDLTTSDGVPGL